MGLHLANETRGKIRLQDAHSPIAGFFVIAESTRSLSPSPCWPFPCFQCQTVKVLVGWESFLPCAFHDTSAHARPGPRMGYAHVQGPPHALAHTQMCTLTEPQAHVLIRAHRHAHVHTHTHAYAHRHAHARGQAHGRACLRTKQAHAVANGTRTSATFLWHNYPLC